jgi:hypothetical protein
MARAVNLVCTDQRDVRAADIKHLPFCLDMFFYGAVRNGQLGRYAFAMLCLDAFCAPCLDCENDKRFYAHNITYATFEGKCFDDWPDIDYDPKDIWPNWK